MTPKPYQTRPVSVEAIQITAENGPYVAEWCDGQWLQHTVKTVLRSACKLNDPPGESEDVPWEPDPRLVLTTPQDGRLHLPVGYWVVRGPKGFRWYPPEEFEVQFEERK